MNGRLPPATSILRTIRSPVRKELARPLGVPAYTVDQVLRQLIQRARALNLKHARPTAPYDQRSGEARLQSDYRHLEPGSEAATVKKSRSKYKPSRKLRVIMLADDKLLPVGDLKDFSEKQRELRKTEFDVRDALEELGHEIVAIGVSDDLSTIRGAIDAHKPHIAFNLVEEFDGIGRFDQHVVSYLELRKQPYTGCNPRGLTLARDKALTKKILAYEGIKVPEFAVFPQRRAFKRPERLAFPLFVKSLTEEGSAGLSSASLVDDEEKLAERIKFIHRTTKSTAIAEQYIEGREIYVGVMGNDRITTLPAWEFSSTKDSDKPLIATDRAKWDPEYQRQHGLKTGPAKLIRESSATAGQHVEGDLPGVGHERLRASRLPPYGNRRRLPPRGQSQPADRQGRGLRQDQRCTSGFPILELIDQLLRLGMRYVPNRLIG